MNGTKSLFNLCPHFHNANTNNKRNSWSTRRRDTRMISGMYNNLVSNSKLSLLEMQVSPRMPLPPHTHSNILEHRDREIKTCERVKGVPEMTFRSDFIF